MLQGVLFSGYDVEIYINFVQTKCCHVERREGREEGSVG